MEQSKLNTSKLLETKDYIYTKEHFWLLEMVSSLWELFLALGSPAEAAVVEKDVMAPQIPTRQRFRVEKPDQSVQCLPKGSLIFLQLTCKNIE